MLIFFFAHSNVFSKDNCRLFFDELRNNNEKYKAQLAPSFAFEDFGFKLDTYYNEEKNEWNYQKDNNGYYSVGSLTSPELSDKIEYGYKIKSVNGKSLEEFNLDFNEEGKAFEDFFKLDDSALFEFETFNIKLTKTYRELFAPYADFFIYSVDIDEKSKKMNARIAFESSHSFDEEDPQYLLAKELLWFDNRQDTIKETISCSYSLDEWNKANFSVPGIISYQNLHSIDLDTFEETISVKPYTDQIEWHKENNWDNELNVEYFASGNYVFNTDFKYQNFPFDRQKIKFQLVNFFDLSSGVLEDSRRTYFKLKEFKEKNSITGWDIINAKVYHDTYRDPVVIDSSDVLTVELLLERQHGYYVYKVILPIIIILMVCWSSTYLAPRELESKLTITIVCLLSLIAYNFIIDKEIPKLEYLTTIDWIVLLSYFYAAMPNILSIYTFNLYKDKNTKQFNKVNFYSKKFGPLSYLFLVIFIIMINVNINPEYASGLFSWMASR